MTEKYRHTKFSSARSIRILEIAPAKWHSDPIYCHLVEMQLPDSFEAKSILGYEALSYVWGSATGDRPIACGNGYLLVTKNCETALRHLRRTWRSRRLWIDAICIDQDSEFSEEEKAQQIPLMGSVYWFAKRTIIWLAEGDKYSKAGIWYARILGQSIAPTWLRTHLMYSRSCGLNCERRQCLVRLIRNPWFKRMWTLQEVVLSRNPVIFIGKQKAAWKCVDNLYQDCVESEFYTGGRGEYDVSFLMRTKIRESWSRGWRQAMSSNLMESTRLLEASRPHDKIYGVYNLYSRFLGNFPAPDYSRPIASIFEEVTLLFIRHEDNLNILETLPSASRLTDLPTWVPDYCHRSEYVEELVFSSRNSFIASTLNSKPIIGYSSPGSISFRGKRIGIVKDHVPSHVQLEFRRTWQDIFRKFSVSEVPSLQRSMLVAEHQAASAENLFKDIFRLALGEVAISEPRSLIELVCVLHHYGNIPESSAMTFTWKYIATAGLSQDMLSELLSDVLTEPALSRLPYPGIPGRTFLYVVSQLVKDNVFITKDGQIGSGYYKLRKEDIIVLLAGGRVPFILRSAGSNYEFIGPAYVYGVMSDGSGRRKRLQRC